MDGKGKSPAAATLLTPAVMVKTLEDFAASDGSGVSVKKGTLLVAFEKMEGPNKATLYHCEGKHGKPHLWVPLSNLALAAKEKLFEVHYFKEKEEEERKRKHKEEKAKKEKDEQERKEKEKRDEKERKEKERKEKEDKKDKKKKAGDKDAKTGAPHLALPDVSVATGAIGSITKSIGDKLFTPRDHNVEISAPTPVSSSVSPSASSSVSPPESSLLDTSSRASVRHDRPPPPNRPPPVSSVQSGSSSSLSVPSQAGPLNGASPRSWSSSGAAPLSASSSLTSLSNLSATAESDAMHASNSGPAATSSSVPKKELPSVPPGRKGTLTLGGSRASGDYSKPLPPPPGASAASGEGSGSSTSLHLPQSAAPASATSPTSLERSQKPLPPAPQHPGSARGDRTKPLPATPAEVAAQAAGGSSNSSASSTPSATPRDAVDSPKRATDAKRSMLQRMHSDKAMMSTLRIKKAAEEKTDEDAKTQQQMEIFVKKALPPPPAPHSHRAQRAEPETAKIEEQGKTIVEALLKMPAKPPAPPAAPAPPPPPAMKKKTDEADKSARLNILPADNLEELFEVEKESTLNTRGAILRWRIEGLLPVARNVNDTQLDPLHVFCSADCYLVLKCPDVDAGTQFYLHYWIGRNASADKIGSVAIRATQLNQLLGGVCKHQREDEGHESTEFTHYYLKMGHALEVTQEGGTESAFRSSAPPPHVTALYRCLFAQPNRSELLRVPLAFASLSADVPYLLDVGERLFVLESSAANKTARFYTRDMAALIVATDRRAKGEVTVLSEAQRQPENAEYAAICRLLGEEQAKPVTVPKASSVIRKKLYKVAQGEDGKLACDIVWEAEATDPTDLAPLSISRDLLSPDHTFVLDCATELFYWFGKRSTPRVRKVTAALAAQILAGEEERPEWVSIVPVTQDSESTLFKRHFADWVSFHRDISHAKEAQAAALEASASKVSAGPRQFATEDYAQLLSHPVDATEAWLPVEGVTQVWYITKGGNKNVTLQERERGHFYSADCYLALHVFSDQSSVQKSVLYFWQGAEAGPRTWPSFQLSLAPMIDKTITAGGHPAPTRVRIMQGRESAHFLHLFGGRMVVHRGTRPPRGVDTVNGLYEARVLPMPPTRPRPKSKDPKEAKPTPDLTHYAYAIQGTSLKGNSHFLLRTDSGLFHWRGSLAPPVATDAGSPMESLMSLLRGANGAQAAAEGDASEVAFYAALPGGRQAYTDAKFWAAHDKPARLFRFANLLAEWSAAEIRHYMQYDLSSSEMAALLLDTQASEIFLWTPTQLTEQGVAAATALARQYVAEAQKAGRAEARLVLVEENKEAIEFTAHFFGWYRKETFKDPYAEREAKMLQEMREQARLQAASEAEEAERRRVELEQRNSALKSKQRRAKLQERQASLLARLGRLDARLAATEAALPKEALAAAAATATATAAATAQLPVVAVAAEPVAAAAHERAKSVQRRQESVLASLAALGRRVDALDGSGHADAAAVAQAVAAPSVVSPAPLASPAAAGPALPPASRNTLWLSLVSAAELSLAAAHAASQERGALPTESARELPVQEAAQAEHAPSAASAEEDKSSHRPSPPPQQQSAPSPLTQRLSLFASLMTRSPNTLRREAEAAAAAAESAEPVQATAQATTEVASQSTAAKEEEAEAEAEATVQRDAPPAKSKQNAPKAERGGAKEANRSADAVLMWYANARHTPADTPAAAAASSEPRATLPTEAAPVATRTEAPVELVAPTAAAMPAATEAPQGTEPVSQPTPQTEATGNGAAPASDDAARKVSELSAQSAPAPVEAPAVTAATAPVADVQTAQAAPAASDALAPQVTPPTAVPNDTQAKTVPEAQAKSAPEEAQPVPKATVALPRSAPQEVQAAVAADAQAKSAAAQTSDASPKPAPEAVRVESEPSVAPAAPPAVGTAPEQTQITPAASDAPAPQATPPATVADDAQAKTAPEEAQPAPTTSESGPAAKSDATDASADAAVARSIAPDPADKTPEVPPPAAADGSAHLARLLSEYAAAGFEVASAIDTARVIFLSMDHWRLFDSTAALDSLRTLFTAQLIPPSPFVHPPPRAPFFWLSVASHLLYFLYASPLSPPSPRPAATTELAAALGEAVRQCIVATAQLCATQLAAAALNIVRSGQAGRNKELSGILSEYHSLLTRDGNLRFAFARFFSRVLSQLDVELFNALMRGPVSCGVGIVLKAALTEVTTWTRAAASLPPNITDCLQRLKQTADVLVMVKSPLVERNVRDAVCPAITPAQLWRLFRCYQPDEFDQSAIHPSVVDLLLTLCDLEVQKKLLQESNTAEVAVAAKPPPPAIEALFISASAVALAPIEKEELTKLTTIRTAVHAPPALPAALVSDAAFAWTQAWSKSEDV